MKHLLTVIAILLFSTAIFAQVNIDNTGYKFSVNFGSGWKTGGTVETDKKDVITYSLNKNNSIASTIIAFSFPSQKKLDDIIYTLEKDFNLNIPQRSGDYTTYSDESYESKSAEYKDKDTYEKIYFYSTLKPDGSGKYYSYMIRFIADNNYKRSDFDFQVSSIIGTFKINL